MTGHGFQQSGFFLATVLACVGMASCAALASTAPAIQIIVSDPEPTTDKDDNASTAGTVTVQAKIGKTVYTGTTPVDASQSAETKAANVAEALKNAKDKDGNGLDLRITVSGNTVDVDNENVSLAIASSGVEEKDTVKRDKFRARKVKLFASLVDPLFGRSFAVDFETSAGIVSEVSAFEPGTAVNDIMSSLAASFLARSDEFEVIGLAFDGLTDDGLLVSVLDPAGMDYSAVSASGGSFIIGIDAAAIPIPGTFGLLAAGVGGLALSHRRSRPHRDRFAA